MAPESRPAAVASATLAGLSRYRAAMCAKLPTNMSRQQWRDWVSPDIDYDEVCPGLPVPDDG